MVLTIDHQIQNLISHLEMSEPLLEQRMKSIENRAKLTDIQMLNGSDEMCGNMNLFKKKIVSIESQVNNLSLNFEHAMMLFKNNAVSKKHTASKSNRF